MSISIFRCYLVFMSIDRFISIYKHGTNVSCVKESSRSLCSRVNTSCLSARFQLQPVDIESVHPSLLQLCVVSQRSLSSNRFAASLTPYLHFFNILLPLKLYFATASWKVLITS